MLREKAYYESEDQSASCFSSINLEESFNSQVSVSLSVKRDKYRTQGGFHGNTVGIFCQW